MFKKKPVIKNLSPLRSSDRRKIADQIILDYSIIVTGPEVSTSTTEDSTPGALSTVLSNLTTVRNSLFPENSQLARFITTAGPELREVQGTVYVGAHPGEEERILWFKVEHGPGADGRLFPTVYTLWHNPHLVPLLHAAELVIGKLRGGADLMTPGLADEPPLPSRAVRGAVAAVASVNRPTVPVFVGVCEIDIAGLGSVQGAKGHAVRGLHWEGDELWAWSSLSRPGRPAPEHLEGWEDKTVELEGQVADITLSDKEADAQPWENDETTQEQNADQRVEESPVVEEKEPTTKEIDEAFVNAFIYALYKFKRDNPSSPNHGLSFPLQPSYVISSLVTPYLPTYTPQQAQYYQIKKTSWKTAKKFIKHLDKLILVKSKDRNGQETVILDVDFNDHRVVEFVPYEIPSKKGADRAGKPSTFGIRKTTTSDTDPSVGQSLIVQNLYRPTGKLVPSIFPALSSTDRSNYYKYSNISARLDQYLESQQPPIVSQENRRFISLNPFLSNAVFASSSVEDQDTVARGKTTRDALLKRLVEDSSLLAPYHIVLRPGQNLEDVKPKAGAAPKAVVTIERRGASKTATKVTGLEAFGVIPNLLADELQRRCASSTSVNQATGAVKGVMEVFVQGDQRKAVETALASRGVKPQWIEIVDKTKKKK